LLDIWQIETWAVESSLYKGEVLLKSHCRSSIRRAAGSGRTVSPAESMPAILRPARVPAIKFRTRDRPSLLPLRRLHRLRRPVISSLTCAMCAPDNQCRPVAAVWSAGHSGDGLDASSRLVLFSFHAACGDRIGRNIGSISARASFYTGGSRSADARSRACQLARTCRASKQQLQGKLMLEETAMAEATEIQGNHSVIRGCLDPDN
jgi:hypothetical protein